MGRYQDGLATIVKLLEGIGGMTRLEIAKMTGRPVNGVTNSLMVLKKRKLIRVGRYECRPDGFKGPPSPVYVAGSGPDAPLPKPIGKREIDKRYRERHAALLTVRKLGDAYTELGVWRGLVR